MCYTRLVKVIRSSDIGNYLYCRRAWWYRKQGYESSNQAELASGTELHRKHGRKVMVAGFYRVLGLFFLLAALVFLVIFFVSQI